jgi:L-lactate dehydrogenase complex protein LldF
MSSSAHSKASGRLIRCRGRGELADKVIDFSSLVKKLVDEGRLKFKEGQQLGKITYHDSCHLKRTLHASSTTATTCSPRPATRVAEMYEADMCCGMGGSYSLKLPEISAPILERKLTQHQEQWRATRR